MALRDWNARRTQCAGFSGIRVLRGGISARSGGMEVSFHTVDATTGRSIGAARAASHPVHRGTVRLAATFPRLAAAEGLMAAGDQLKRVPRVRWGRLPALSRSRRSKAISALL